MDSFCESRLMRLPLEIRNIIYSHVIDSSNTPFFLSQAITYPSLPGIQFSLWECQRRASARFEHAILSQFGLPAPPPMYGMDPLGIRAMRMQYDSPVLQLRLVSRSFGSEITNIIFGGVADGAELWIRATNAFVDMCGHATRDHDPVNSRKVTTKSVINGAEAIGILRWIRRWKRLVFLLPESHIQSIGVLSHIIERDSKHVIKLVITGFDNYFWDFKVHAGFSYPRYNIGNGQLPESIGDLELLSNIAQSKDIEMRHASNCHSVQNRYYTRTIYYRIRFRAVFADGNTQFDVEGEYIQGTKKGTLQKLYGHEPEWILPSESILPS